MGINRLSNKRIAEFRSHVQACIDGLPVSAPIRLDEQEKSVNCIVEDIVKGLTDVTIKLESLKIKHEAPEVFPPQVIVEKLKRRRSRSLKITPPRN
jgi:hypothetical protein